MNEVTLVVFKPANYWSINLCIPGLNPMAVIPTSDDLGWWSRENAKIFAHNLAKELDCKVVERGD